MQVRIYRPAKSAMQSGRGTSKLWVVDSALPTPRRPEPLMGWTSADDTQSAFSLRFASAEEAVRFATQQGWSYDLEPAQERRITPRSFLDNFKPDQAVS